MTRDDKISRILKLELEITEAIFHGHKPNAEDIYKEKREELKRLRKEIEEDKTFKQKSKWTKYDSSTSNKT